ncbi:HD domain-containing phosphohydrolase [Marinisporobacter balticus]|uniref:HD-GYP domain-containing protein (C-di-GMP phosphodiesterase class II) n=1 Tax=Marinisporobacter balticus TaxID=2018667 RepID=A0A4R2L194_9FIRM|nr:HD domain-containing phosphohydrolase [Marinisporobacter balticus]TCO77486.1 HD-GYP domain-containing protein (c-di-GMP phosphodiesterase class II) [Marinisporobacter balticus]
MKMKTKIILLVCFSIVVTVLTITLQTNVIIERSREKILELYAHSRIKVMNNYLLETSQELENRVYDNTCWDDAFYNLEEENIPWIKENITAYLYEQPNFQIDLVFLQKNDGTYNALYGENISKDDLIVTNAYKKARSGKIMNKEYIKIRNNVYEIVAAPIRTAKDETKTNGILLLGRAINEKFLMKLSGYLTLDHGEKINMVKNHSQSNDFSYHNNYMVVYHPVKDRDGNNLTWIKVSYDISNFDHLKYLVFKEIILTVILYSTVLAGIAMFFINKSMNKIQKSITQINAIAQGNYKNRLEEKGSHEMIELAKSVNRLSEEIETRILAQENNYLESVKALATSLEIKDAYTKGHSDRVAFYATHLGKVVGYESLDDLTNAALVHDIGKIAVSDTILNKPGKLTDEEYEIIKKHPALGYKILDASHMFKHIKYIIKYHHEKYDGKGYPDGLCGKDIPLGARILAIADVFDALTSNRAYRKEMPIKEAMEIIIEGSGTHFDAALVEAFEGIIYKLYEETDL